MLHTHGHTHGRVTRSLLELLVAAKNFGLLRILDKKNSDERKSGFAGAWLRLSLAYEYIVSSRHKLLAGSTL